MEPVLWIHVLKELIEDTVNVCKTQKDAQYSIPSLNAHNVLMKHTVWMMESVKEFLWSALTEHTMMRKTMCVLLSVKDVILTTRPMDFV